MRGCVWDVVAAAHTGWTSPLSPHGLFYLELFERLMVKYYWYIPFSPLCKYSSFGGGAKIRTFLDFSRLLLSLLGLHGDGIFSAVTTLLAQWSLWRSAGTSVWGVAAVIPNEVIKVVYMFVESPVKIITDHSHSHSHSAFFLFFLIH